MLLGRFYINQLRNQRGFIIFVVVGILTILGMTLATLNWMTRQQNTQSHKALYNEVARTSAKAAVQILIRALREGTKTPPDSTIKKLLTDSLFYERSFYGYFLQPISSMPNESEIMLSHDQLLNLFSDNIKNIYFNFLKATPNLEINFELTIRPEAIYSSVTGGEIMHDQTEKKVDLELSARATYRGSEKTFKLDKFLMVYNLVGPITSKFTFFHKSSVGNRYNQLITNILGKPILNSSGGFKYKNNFPLILINGPLGNDPRAPGDSILLKGRSGSDFRDMDYLSDPAEVNRSKESLLNRGFLFFGPGDENVLKLTPGSEPTGWGEYFHLFNPYIGTTPNTYIAEVMNGPDFFNSSYTIENDSPLNNQTKGSAVLQSIYEGFYEPDAYNYFQPNPSQGIIGNYSAYSSLIHPFGSYQAFSRAYTVGNAYRAVAKISSIGVDRVDDSNDENEQINCLQVPSVQKRDGRLAILRETTLDGWLGQREFTMNPITRSMDNLHKVRPLPDGTQYVCNDEPNMIHVGPEFNYDSIFVEFEQYANYMSKIEYIPINHTIDYPHYTHRIIPPNDHEEFSEFMFPPHAKDRLFEFPDSNTETWFLAPTQIHPEKRLYLKGDSDNFYVDNLNRAREFFTLSNPIDGSEALEKEGYLKKRGNQLILNTHGHLISLFGDLTFDRDLIVEGHSSITVTGNCKVGPVKTAYYFNLHCSNISLRNSGSLKNYNIDAFLNSEGSLSKENELDSISIQGGLAVKTLDFSIFQAPTTVLYNPNHSPMKQSYQLFYRMVIDDHNRNWKAQI